LASLFINDLFFTLQGEGQHWGRRALFVRMPHCNLACSWCDTTYDTHEKWSFEEFEVFALQEETRFAVVTGGEPLMHKHTPAVVGLLQKNGFYVACETNGTFAPNASFDWITCSPKRDAKYEINAKLYARVSEFKYVVDDGFDFSVLKRHDDDPASVAHSLSPEYGTFEESVARIIDYIQENPMWRLSLQTHKIVGIP